MAANEDYRLLALQTYQAQREAYRFTSQIQAEYGRWLIATIAAIHVAGIYLISSISDVDLADKRASIWVLVVGLVLILLSGLAAWVNWSAAAQLFSRWSDANMLINQIAWPKDDAETVRLGRRRRVTMWGSVVAGVLSVLCIPLANTLI